MNILSWNRGSALNRACNLVALALALLALLGQSAVPPAAASYAASRPGAGADPRIREQAGSVTVPGQAFRAELTLFSYLPVVAKACVPYLYDNFSNLASGWQSINDANSVAAYLYGEYQILVKRTNDFAYSTRDFGLTDYRVEVDARAASGLTNGGVGLIFGINPGGYYLFEIKNASYILQRRDNDPGATVTRIPWTTTPAIRTGTQVNRLSVVRKASNISMYVNGQFLASISDNTYAGTRFGMEASADANNFDARFDNFTIYNGSDCLSP